MADVSRYVLIRKFAELTGYTEKAVRRKLESNAWIEGEQYIRAPDGHPLIDMEGYYRWVRGEKANASNSDQPASVSALPTKENAAAKQSPSRQPKRTDAARVALLQRFGGA